MHIAILGAGAWGTALAIHFSRTHQVTLWTRQIQHANALRQQRVNSRYLPDIPLPASIRIEANLNQALSHTDLALVATPMAGLRPTLQVLTQSAYTAPVVWACKGLEQETMLLPHAVAEAVLPLGHTFGMLSGPSFALEVAQGLPAAITLASSNQDFAHAMAEKLHDNRLRIYSSTDLIGIEIGAAVKNIMAIAAGVSDGLALGHNARAALLTRGMAEMARFGVALGAQTETFMGLAGLGDLILTATGNLSRNRQVGLMLAEGKSLDEAVQSLGHVAEGVPTTREVTHQAQQLNIDMPITFAVYQLLFANQSASAVVNQLMGRRQKAE
jgi:glycerol-3-phosphate dehydrogenase (NAD(P)+)